MALDMQTMETPNSRTLEWSAWRDLARLAAEALAIGVVFSVLLALAVFIIARTGNSGEASLQADATTRAESRASVTIVASTGEDPSALARSVAFQTEAARTTHRSSLPPSASPHTASLASNLARATLAGGAHYLSNRSALPATTPSAKSRVAAAIPRNVAAIAPPTPSQPSEDTSHHARNPPAPAQTMMAIPLSTYDMAPRSRYN